MIQHQRHGRILELVRQRKSCTVNELRKDLGVSQVTLYRDLRGLTREKLLRRVRGGVVLREREKIESRFSIRLDTNRAAKERIGRHAAAMVKEGWAIFVDASSTCYFFARELAMRRLPGLTIVTNSPQIPLEFEQHLGIRVISTGGELLHELNAFGGPLTITQLSSLGFGAAFISCAGLSRSFGATTESPQLAEVIRKVAANSRQVILLADGSKFAQQALLTSLPVEDLDRVITDSSAPQERIDELLAAHIEVEVVEE